MALWVLRKGLMKISPNICIMLFDSKTLYRTCFNMLKVSSKRAAIGRGLKIYQDKKITPCLLFDQSVFD